MPMRPAVLLRALLLWGTLAVMVSTGSAQQGVSWSQIEALPKPPAGEVVAYGEAPSQVGELRLPQGEGPFPVAVLIHGGCWQHHYGVDHIAPLAADLNERGIATWAIEYRRLGESGGGWPGTFDDVVAGLTRLESLAADKPLDVGRMALVGHSAGGHLALWLAARNRLPVDHRWHADLPGGMRGVVGLAAISDLARYAEGEGDCNRSAEALLGGDESRREERLALASPDRLLPPAVPVHLVHGRADAIVGLEQSVIHAARVRAAGGQAHRHIIERAGHFDLIAPFAPAWAEARSVIMDLLEVDSVAQQAASGDR